MPAQPMSRSDEDRICRAIGRVADLVEAGEGPDGAIAKAAAAAGVPRGHLGLMVHAYNIGRTNRQREDGATPAEKAASFPIATLEGVLGELFPAEVATKAAAERATGIDPIYLARPRRFDRKPATPMAKAAGGPIFAVPGAVADEFGAPPDVRPLAAAGAGLAGAAALPVAGGLAGAGLGAMIGGEHRRTAGALIGGGLGVGGSLLAQKHLAPAIQAMLKAKFAAAVDPARALELVINRRQKRAKAVAEARRVVGHAQDRLREGLRKLAAAFDAPGGPAPDDVRANVEALHGAEGLLLLDEAVRASPRLCKRAASRRFAAHAVADLPRVYDGLADTLALADDALAVRDWHAALAKEAARLDRVELAPFRGEPRSALAAIDLDAAVAAEKRAAGFDLGERILGPKMNGALGTAADQIHGGDGDAAAAKALARLASPEHEQDLRAIQARAMLHEMLHDDEVLRGHDPFEVARHFNRLSRYAPRTADQPLAAIPAVRKSVQQGQLDSFDARELADTEGKLRDIHPHGGGRPPAAPAAPKK